MKDYYKILGVKPDAPQAEIKKAYRLLAVQHHPDKNSGDKASEERFKEISEAYIILGDTAKRNAYDYTKSYQKISRDRNILSGKSSSAAFHTLFKRIKNKVLNANGQVNKEMLFKVIDDLLSDETIVILIHEGDIVTNNLITDDILTCCIFLPESLKAVLYTKLEKLANGDPRFTEKVALLNKKNHLIGNHNKTNTPADASEPRPAVTTILIFAAIITLFIILLFILRR